MTIRCIYDQEPNFPATDQHPDAKRYRIAGKWVDAIGEPTEEEVMKILEAKPAPKLDLTSLLVKKGIITKSDLE